MPKIVYTPRNFKQASLYVIAQAIRILEDYESQGYDLTLRQLYYQFVSKDLIPNKQSEYDKLGSIINDARLAGYIDWNHIVDRTRNVRTLSHWDGPHSVIRSAARGYNRDCWEDQPTRCEVWIEKDALVGVIAGVCERFDVPYFSCRGYTSQSEMWSAAQRIGEHVRRGTDMVIFHLGDHDPSGIDMTRDIEDRLTLFIEKDNSRFAVAEAMEEMGITKEEIEDNKTALVMAAKEKIRSYGNFEVRRIALTMAQIHQYNPPPNPAKMSDARARGYVARYGNESWELDALEPSVLDALIERNVVDVMDEDLFNEKVNQMEKERSKLMLAANRWTQVQNFLDGEGA